MWEVTAGGAEREVGSHGESEEARASHVHESFLILSKEAQAGQLHRPHCRSTLSQAEESGNLQTLPLPD